MHFALFLLLFAIFFVLVGIVFWSIRDAGPNPPAQADTLDNKAQETLPSNPDEAVKWLEDFAERQANSGKKRIH